MRSCARSGKAPSLAPWAVAVPRRSTPSACEPHRAWIEAQVQLGRNATSLYQELVDAVRILGGDSVTTRRSFWNDLLIATSCARAGAILLTSNKADFARIRRVVPVDMVALRS